MASIQEFAGRVDAAFDALHTSVAGIETDVTWLKDEIVRLNNTPGPISPEDQALLDAIEARATALVTRVQTLDAATETPPTP